MPDVKFSAEQARAVDAFIDALMHDPKTANPADLPPDLAEFVRNLLQAEQVNVAHDVQARVWRRAYVAAQVKRLRQPNIQARGTPMTTSSITLTPRRVSLTNNLTMLAAASAVVVFVAGMLAFNAIKPTPPSPSSPAFGSNGLQEATSTIIPSATFTPTSVGRSVVLPPAESTATAAVEQTANAVIDPMGTATPFPNLEPSLVPTSTPFLPTVPPLMVVTPTIVPGGYGGGVGLPSDLFNNPTTVAVNTTVTGQLTPEQPYSSYSIPIEEDGMLNVIGLSSDFSIGLSHQYLEGGQGGGGGGGGTSDGSFIPRAEVVMFVKKGSQVNIAVFGMNGEQSGNFSLQFNFDKGRILTDLQESISASFESDSDRFHYYLFSAAPGTQLDITASALDGLDLNMMLVEFTTTMGGNAFVLGLPTVGCTSGNMLTFCQDDNSGKGSDPELTNVTIRANSLYALVVRSVTPGKGSYVVSIAEHAPLSIDATPQTLKLNSQVRSGSVVFTGEAGKSYLLSATISGTQQGISINVLQNGNLLAYGQLGRTSFEQVLTAVADAPIVIMAEYAAGLQVEVVPAEIVFSVTPQ